MISKRLSFLRGYLIVISAVTVLYYITARIGFFLAIPPGNVTVLWPPSGVAFAAMLMFNWPAGIGIFLGSLLANLGTMSGPIALPVSIAIAAGSTLQSYLVVFLVRRFVGKFPPDSIHAVLRSLWIIAVSVLVAPGIGVTSICLAGNAPWANFMSLALTWWLGDYTGILIFSPTMIVLLMKWHKQQVKEPLLWALTCFIIGLALMFFLTVRTVTQQQAVQNFEQDFKEITHVVQNAIDQDMMTLTAIRALYAASQSVESKEFTTFTSQLRVNTSSTLAYTWAPRVMQAQRPAFEQSIRGSDHEDFFIYEKDPQGNPIPAPVREVYYPIMMIEPEITNATAQGFDLGSDPVRLATIIQARDSGEHAATAPVQFMQDAVGGKSILIMIPIYQNGTLTNTPQDRRNNFLGIVYEAFHLGDMVSRPLEGINRHDLELYFFDITDPFNPFFLYFYPSISGQQSLPITDELTPLALQTGNFRTDALNIGGRKWLVIARPGSAYFSDFDKRSEWVSLVIGFLLSGAFLVYVNNRQKNEALVARSEAEYRALAENSLTGIAQVKMTGEILYSNDAMAMIFGFESPIEFIRENILHFFSDPDQFKILGQLLLVKSQIRQQELDIKPANGERKHLLFSAGLNQDVVSVTAMDITDRIRADKEIRRLSQVVTQTADTVVITDTRGTIEYVNPAFEQLAGYSLEEARGQTPRVLKSGLETTEFYDRLWNTILSLNFAPFKLKRKSI